LINAGTKLSTHRHVSSNLSRGGYHSTFYNLHFPSLRWLFILSHSDHYIQCECIHLILFDSRYGRMTCHIMSLLFHNIILYAGYITRVYFNRAVTDLIISTNYYFMSTSINSQYYRIPLSVDKILYQYNVLLKQCRTYIINYNIKLYCFWKKQKVPIHNIVRAIAQKFYLNRDSPTNCTFNWLRIYCPPSGISSKWQI